ncbi:MAG: alpha-amlyase [Flavobacteriales bacterium]|nr:alpha-amlyase [Flavobacteriales bacterium]
MENIPEQKEYELFSPITLAVDTTEIVIKDFLIDQKIDSISSDIDYLLSEDKRKIFFISDDDTPILSILKLWTNGVPYSVLVKKNMQKKVVLSYLSKGKKFSEVSIVGEFNDWNPSLGQMRLINGNWQLEKFMNPGSYQYQIVLDKEWRLDDGNPKTVSNGNGGLNSILEVEGSVGDPPKLSFQLKQGDIQIISESANEIFVFCDNTQIESEKILVIPEKIKQKKYSYVRVFSFNKNGESNSLLIPLKFGTVITQSSDLYDQDKYASNLYFILVDRFLNGNKQNDNPVNDVEVHKKANYHGGDLDGILQKLKDGYFSDLGVNTIWLSPVTQNPLYAEVEYPAPHRKYSGYHGYWPISCTKIDTRFGNSETLKELVEVAHQKGIRVLLDFVANHVHENNPVMKKHPQWATNFILEDGRENIRIWDEERLTTWFDRFLPTIDYSIPEAVDLMTDSALFMMSEYNLDGFRHDATKHIPTIFWRTLTNKIKTSFPDRSIYQIGETFGSRELIASYVATGQLDGQFDFNLYFDSRVVFAQDEVSFTQLHNSLMETFLYYGNHSLMGNITGNHDIPRFISYAGEGLSFGEDAKKAGWERKVKIHDAVGYNKLQMLTAFIMTIPGIPVIYYGDEIGMVGAGDPDNRRPMIFDGLNFYQQDVKKNAKDLLHLRKSKLSLLYGDFNLLELSDTIYVYERNYLDQKTIVLFNKGVKPVNINLNEDISAFKQHFSSKIENNNVTLFPYSFEILTLN